ncbi:hypothetical protein VE03_03479 [Pseudogymnoascus sp. 23342-1-I1]|nr:hypothetical protein VE03_03479 [Pseudogymnoascus sp. 23342-1-I1]
MGRLLSFNNLSAYVSSVGACTAQCLGSPACTSFYFTQAKSCNVFYGPISFSPNGNPGSEIFYDVDCFSCHSTTTCPPPRHRGQTHTAAASASPSRQRDQSRR